MSTNEQLSTVPLFLVRATVGECTLLRRCKMEIMRASSRFRLCSNARFCSGVSRMPAYIP